MPKEEAEMAGKETHGLTNLKRVVRGAWYRRFGCQITGAKALRAWRRCILDSLGGEENLSAAHRIGAEAVQYWTTTRKEADCQSVGHTPKRKKRTLRFRVES